MRPTDQGDDSHVEQAVGPSRRPWNQWRYEPDPQIVANVEAELIFEGERRTPYLFRFFTLLILSTMIAAFGLLADSTAVVIAAMIVAPLMMPIMGISLGMVSGRPRRQLDSLILVVVATLVITVLAVMIALFVPDPAVIPGEILGRTEPTLVDLSIAIAAGLAGGYSIARQEASSALAGVAIGVSLVPPLAAFGLLLGWRHTDLAPDALLLYLTNLAAIIFCGAIIFTYYGFMPVSHLGEAPRRIQFGLLVASLSVLIVAYPLYSHSRTVTQRATTEQTVGGVIEEQIAGTDFVLIGFHQDGDQITVDIAGPAQTLEESPTPPQDAADALSAALGRRVDLKVRFFPYATFTAISNAGEE